MPISRIYAGNQRSDKASGKEGLLTTIAGNHLNDDAFPAFGPSWPLQVLAAPQYQPRPVKDWTN